MNAGDHCGPHGAREPELRAADPNRVGSHFTVSFFVDSQETTVYIGAYEKR